MSPAEITMMLVVNHGLKRMIVEFVGAVAADDKPAAEKSFKILVGAAAAICRDAKNAEVNEETEAALNKMMTSVPPEVRRG